MAPREPIVRDANIPALDRGIPAAKCRWFESTRHHAAQAGVYRRTRQSYRVRERTPDRRLTP